MLKGHLGFKGESSTIDISEKVDGVQTITVSDYRGTQTTTIEDGELTGDMVIDNLTSDTTNRPLSAKQGKVLNTSINTTNTNIGNLSDLDTTDKTSIVNAINEVNTIGDTIIFSKPGYENVQSSVNTTMGYSTKDASNSSVDFCSYDDSTKKYTITQTGLYLIILNNQWAEVSGAGIRYQEIYHSDRRYAMQTSTATTGQKTSTNSSCVLALNANDEFVVRLYQTSGVVGSVEYGSRMYIVKLK